MDGGAWGAQDFTVHVRDVERHVQGSPQPGSGAGTDHPLFAGRYIVAQDAARGYAATIGGDCAGDGSIVLANGDHKTCTITNRAVPLAAGAVVETYGPNRTDGDWGLAESYLDETRAYLLDPASFGPQGVVGRPIVVGPGIGVANDRTLAGVDVLFTGWVPTGSYSIAEKAALRAFVLAGGTLIATTDDSGHTMVDAFGLTQGDGGGNADGQHRHRQRPPDRRRPVRDGHRVQPVPGDRPLSLARAGRPRGGPQRRRHVACRHRARPAGSGLGRRTSWPTWTSSAAPSSAVQRSTRR